MSYDIPRVITYSFPAVDFGAGDSAAAIKAPLGYRNGRIVDVAVNVTEVFNQVSTPGHVHIGTSGDADAYVDMNMAAAAAGSVFNTQDDIDAIIDGDVDEVQLEVAFIAPVGGTPTGIGDVSIAIAWSKA